MTTKVRSSVIADSGVVSAIYGGISSIPVINIGADGRITSASNVAVSGMTTTGYVDKVQTVGTISTTPYNIDLSVASVYDITLGANTTITFSNGPSSGNTKPITLIVRQPAVSPGKTLTVTGAKYTDGVTPILSTGANQVDVLMYWSIDGGSTYFGTYAMANVA